MKHRKETQEYNTDVFKYSDTDGNGYLDWEEYIKMVVKLFLIIIVMHEHIYVM